MPATQSTIDRIERTETPRFSGDGIVRFYARQIVEHELLDGEWATTREVISRLNERLGRGLMSRSAVLSALSGLSAIGHADMAEQFGPSRFSSGQYVWRLDTGLEAVRPCCKVCGNTHEHVWVEGTPASNVHAYTAPDYAAGTAN